MFLQTAAAGLDNLSGFASTGIIGMLIGLAIFVFLIIIGIYIYMSFAYMAIGRRAKLSAPGIAWIPGVGPLITAFRTSKMHWWPWLLLIGVFFMGLPNIGIYIYATVLVLFEIFALIWSWKMFEAVKRPGWWALVSLLGLLIFVPAGSIGGIIGVAAIIVNFVLIGIAAWGKN